MDKTKLKYILMWSCVIVFIALSVFLLCKVTGKFENEEKDKDPNKIYVNHISTDGNFSLDAPSTYVKMTEHSLNAKGVIELNNEEKSSYILVVPTSKINMSKTFDKFRDETFAQKEGLYETKITSYKKLTIDEHAAEYGVIYYTNYAGINIYIRTYVIETDNYFVQMILWTVADNEKSVQEEFNKIADSFREVKKIDN